MLVIMYLRVAAMMIHTQSHHMYPTERTAANQVGLIVKVNILCQEVMMTQQLHNHQHAWIPLTMIRD